VTETTDAEDGGQVRGPRPGYLDRLVGGHSGTAEWRRVERVKADRYSAHEGGLGQRVLGVRAVDAVSRILLVGAQCFTPGSAVLARPTGITQPRNGHPVTLGEPSDTLP
jgi:hypothetical protein